MGPSRRPPHCTVARIRTACQALPKKAVCITTPCSKKCNPSCNLYMKWRYFLHFMGLCRKFYWRQFEVYSPFVHVTPRRTRSLVLHSCTGSRNDSCAGRQGTEAFPRANSSTLSLPHPLTTGGSSSHIGSTPKLATKLANEKRNP